MQWVNIANGHVRSFCGRFILLWDSVVHAWDLYDCDEYVETFENISDAMLLAEESQRLGQSW